MKPCRLIQLPNEDSTHQLPMTCSTWARPANRGAGINRAHLCYSPQSCSRHLSHRLCFLYVAAESDARLKPFCVCIWKRLVFHRKHALCIKLDQISSAHNHINSVMLLSEQDRLIASLYNPDGFSESCQP